MANGTLDRPGVTVYQQLVNLSPTIIRPVLNCVIVGPCNQIENGTGAGSYNGSLTTYAYPDLVTNAVVDTDTVEVFLSNADGRFDATNYAGVIVQTTGVTIPAGMTPSKSRIADKTIDSVSASSSFVDTGTDFFAAGVQAGDTLTFVTDVAEAAALGVNVSVNVGSYLVLSVVSPTELELDTTLTAETDVAYNIDKVTTASGSILISYQARRKDGVNTLYEHADTDEADTDLGEDHPDNPLRFAVGLALANTDRVVLSTMVENDTVSDFQAALEFLETEEVYAVVCLSQNTVVHQLAQAHVDQMSLARNKKERMTFISRSIETEIEYQSLSTTGVAGGVPQNKFTDSNAQFVTNGVPVGAYIELEGTPGQVLVGGIPTSTLRISSIISETEVRLVEDVDAPVTDLSYTVTSGTLSKAQQARNLQEYAEAYDDRRVVHVVPDTYEVSASETDVLENTTSSSTELVEGHFMCAALAGQASSLPPAQGHTTLPVAGFVSLRKSNKYFSETQLGIIAAGGNWIMIQENEGDPLTTRHQLTTEVGFIETREYSILKAIDYSAKFIRERLSPLIGRNNITDEFVSNIVRTSISAIVNDLIEGAVVGAGTNIVRVEVSEDQPDTIVISIDYQPLYPCNYIEVTLEV